MLIKKAVQNDKTVNHLFTYILIAPPNIEELKKRLTTRATDTEDIIAKRLSYAKDELAQWKRYDYLIINDKLEIAEQQLSNIIETQHTKSCLFEQK